MRIEKELSILYDEVYDLAIPCLTNNEELLEEAELILAHIVRIQNYINRRNNHGNKTL